MSRFETLVCMLISYELSNLLRCYRSLVSFALPSVTYCATWQLSVPQQYCR